MKYDDRRLVFFGNANFSTRRATYFVGKPMRPPDPTLAELAKAYEQHGHALLQYLRRSVHDADHAQDLLQETLLQAARRPAADSPGSFDPGLAVWYCQEAALTALRRRRRRTFELTCEVVDVRAQADPRLESMRAAINRLPLPLREVLAMRLQSELSYAEIAAVLQLPLSTVRSRLHEAIRRLRRDLVAEDES